MARNKLISALVAGVLLFSVGVPINAVAASDQNTTSVSENISKNDGLYIRFCLSAANSVKGTAMMKDLADDSELILSKDGKQLETLKLKDGNCTSDTVFFTTKFKYADYKEGETYTLSLKTTSNVGRWIVNEVEGSEKDGVYSCDFSIEKFACYEDMSDKILGYELSGSLGREIYCNAGIDIVADKKIGVLDVTTKKLVPNLEVTLKHKASGNIFKFVSDENGYLKINLDEYEGIYAINSVGGSYLAVSDTIGITNVKEENIEVRGVTLASDIKSEEIGKQKISVTTDYNSDISSSWSNVKADFKGDKNYSFNLNIGSQTVEMQDGDYAVSIDDSAYCTAEVANTVAVGDGTFL